jgi:hypothetical protein
MPKELQYKTGNSQRTRIRLRYGLINPPLSLYVLILIVITHGFFDAMTWALSKRNSNPHLGLKFTATFQVGGGAGLWEWEDMIG